MTFIKPKKVLITTAIDYANDVIHVGHAYEKILADCYARYCKKIYGEKNVFFVTGTDEHGTTNQQAAEKNNVSPKQHVDNISNLDKEQIDSLQVNYDRFIRTTDEDHKKIASDFFAKAVQTGVIYKDIYKGLYCAGCESYKTESELNDQKQCTLHPTKQIQIVEEENYFFKWSDFAQYLKDLINNNPNFIKPDKIKNEMLAFLNEGLENLPVSRPKYKVSWGIQSPNDENHVLYVWYDALINYYTFACQHNLWNDETLIIHFVGKDILRFHTLLWPAMLKNVGLRVPSTVYAHGFLNLNGQKISKSLGNVIKPTELVQKYGVDATRFYILKHGPIVEDTNISLEQLQEVYNGDLANSLGNTVSRIAKLAQNNNLQIEEFQITPQLIQNLFNSDIYEPIKDFRVDLVISNIWKKISDLEKQLNIDKPWEVNDTEKVNLLLVNYVNQIRELALLIEPFMPSASQKILEQYSGTTIKIAAPLFPRIID